MISSVSNQIQNQQVDFYIIKDSLTITDTSTVTSNQDTIFIFSEPQSSTIADSLYHVLTNPLTVKNSPTGEYGFVPKQKTQYVSDWTIAIILVLLILLASIRNTSETYLLQIFQSIFSKKAAIRLFREKVSTLFHISFRLDVFYLLVTGLFIFQIVNHFSEFTQKEEILYCGLIVIAFSVFVFTKFTLYRISGTIFDAVPETREYIFHAKTGNRVMGLILFPVVLFLFFIEGNYAEYLLYFGIALVFILNIINILRGMAIFAQKVISVYYLILYLCTLEILPIIIVWKILLIM